MPAPRADIRYATFAIAGFFAACLLALWPTAADASLDSAAGGAGFVQQPLSAPDGAFAGRNARVEGHVSGYSGRVSITARRGSKGDYLPLGTARADADGDFSFNWKPAKAGLYRVRVAPLGAASAAADLGTQGSLAVYRRQKATWYGPESYGSRTACGQKLTKRTLGVAHKTLPCGTRVEFFLRGKRITLPVIDRGPYANAAVWDLTLTAMKRLGSSSTEFLGAVVVN